MLPVCPVHYGQILGDDDVTLDHIGDGFSGLPAWRPQVLRRAEGLKADLVEAVRERPELGQAIQAAVGRFNGTPGDAKSWTRARRPHPSAVLARRAVPHRRRRHQLPPLLQHQRPRRPAHGAAGGVRPCAPPRGHHAARRHHRRSAHRPHRRPPRPQGLSRTAARPRAEPAGAGPLSRGREDPRAPRSRCGPTGRSTAPPATR